MVFQVSKTRLRILAVLSNAVVWIVSTRPPTSKSSRPFNNPLVIVPQAPITIGTVEKRKISYFALARYLIQHWISPNQDDISHSARTFISG